MSNKKNFKFLSEYEFLKDKLTVLKDSVLNISKINELKKIDDFSDEVHEFINGKFFYLLEDLLGKKILFFI